MKRSILFTGHMIDAKDRTYPRFPASKEINVREEIRKHLLDLKSKFKNELFGIAGGACGGDILFHELCAEMNITSEIYLALPAEKFKKASVSFAGPMWEERFDQLIESLPVNILAVKEDERSSDNVWERANLWMLDIALSNGGNNMILIALWDGKAGDGNGGTEHMVKVANEKGAEVFIIDINRT
jgi:hypothetical protein